MSQQNEMQNLSNGMAGILCLVKILNHFGIQCTPKEFMETYKGKEDAGMKDFARIAKSSVPRRRNSGKLPFPPSP